MDVIEYFICGGFGGICTVIVGHPLDTIKVRLQTMPKPQAGEPPLYTGMLDCFRKTVAKEGALGLYKGIGAPLATIVPIFSMSFMSYAVGKKLFGPKEGPLSSLQFFLSGGFAGIVCATVMSPGERIKCLLQIQSDAGEKKYNGTIDCARKLYKEAGVKSVYKGFGATVMRDAPASGLFYLTYETLINFFSDGGKREVGMLSALVAGGAAGMSNWIVGMPADVLKSRLQTAPEGSYPGGVKDVLHVLLKNEGPLALYKGMAPVMLRAFPANAACFVGFEICKKFLNSLKS